MNKYGPEDREFFRKRYASTRSAASRRVERLALGHEVGLNGFTTVPQAQRLAEALAIDQGTRALDVGAGRGWPGTHVAHATGARVVLSDIPVEALRQIPRTAQERGVAGRVSAVCADATNLPFGPRLFDAVVHADVLC